MQIKFTFVASAFTLMLVVAGCASSPSASTRSAEVAQVDAAALNAESADSSGSVDADDPIVCKRVGNVSTRINKRYCYRQSQWDQAELESERAMDHRKSEYPRLERQCAKCGLDGGL